MPIKNKAKGQIKIPHLWEVSYTPPWSDDDKMREICEPIINPVFEPIILLVGKAGFSAPNEDSKGNLTGRLGKPAQNET